MSQGRVVILGAGHAGGSAAAALRHYGHEGPIVLVGEEPLPALPAPAALSKAWLKGEADEEELQLRPASFYAENHIAVRLGVRATRIDRDAKQVALSDQEILPYDFLIVATGARARRLALPGGEMARTLELRTAADAEDAPRHPSRPASGWRSSAAATLGWRWPRAPGPSAPRRR